MKSEIFVSVVMIVDHTDPALKTNLAEVRQTLDAYCSDYEILLVVQGPVHRQIPYVQETELLADIPCVRLIQLAFDVNLEVAKAAGIENAIGDFVILYDADCDPPELIVQAVEVCRRGSDIVIGTCCQKLSIGQRLMQRWAAVALKAIKSQIPADTTNFCCLSRRAINAVINTGHFYYQFTFRLQKTGYPVHFLPYSLKATSRQHPLFVLPVRRLLSLLVFSSTRPLHWMSIVGLVGSCFAFVFASYSVILHLVRTGIMEGWTTTILFMSVQFMFMFIILAFLSEYMRRILDEKRGGTEYAVVYEKSSAIMVNSGRVNVLNEAVSDNVNLVQTARNG